MIKKPQKMMSMAHHICQEVLRKNSRKKVRKEKEKYRAEIISRVMKVLRTRQAAAAGEASVWCVTSSQVTPTAASIKMVSHISRDRYISNSRV